MIRFPSAAVLASLRSAISPIRSVIGNSKAGPKALTEQQAALDLVRAAYLAKSEPVDEDALRQWQPSGLAWPLLREVQRLASGMSKRSMEVDGHRLVWMEGGNARGEPVLLLHGFTSSKENWLLMLPFLMQRYRLYVLDLPAWGESQYIHGRPYTLDRQAERVAEWARRAIGVPAHVVGSSMGGAIAGLLAARHASQVASLTLMNAAGMHGENSSPFERGLAEGRNGLLASRLSEVIQLLENVIERNRATLPLALAPLMYSQFTRRRMLNLHLFAQMIKTPHVELAGVQVPTLVLWGEQDRILDVSSADAFLAVIPHAVVKKLRGVGHLPMVEVPGVTARRLRKFWEAQKVEKLAVAA
ncbi:alpha/beta fold hydrolase [Solimonas sp. K1W22B-7]|uniref:alpha/beta fold hydrolase n=1 Tax=Solimonas sp. K1W22B-7 TaxID=2303331 RepID=UPI000E32FC13|nr:alpha/beta fold hydrolase [Solimonas sp. K1W22B-7]AXQ28132.1 alpha/beta fold hydrolase [Solimonas sp. K1W22B-7]